jgi:serine/threonine-protein kinase
MSQEFVGEKLGSFRLEEVLGSGAMGVVFRGTHETTGRPVAVKIVHAELSQKGKVFDRFEREAEILKQFRHPHIVRWLAWGRFRGTSYFAMEYVDGPTLERILQDRGELPWREVVELGIQLCDALHYAHELNVVHRDLKPSNLMITPEGTLKLTDFGIAKDLDRTTQLTAPGRTLGTAAYMAPEQIRGTPAVSHKTDLYALGVLFYQMLTGKPPFEGASAVVLMHCHLNEPPPRPSDKVEQIPKELDDLVVKLMAKAPADRPWDAVAVGQILKDLRERDEAGQPIPMVWPEPGSARSNPSRAPVGVPPSVARRKRARETAAAETGPIWLSRGVLETSGLVALLVAIGGFIGYWLWPPSAEYLHRQAVALMASSHRSDWITAQDDYVEPLERRFPDHPYKDEIKQWREKIELDEAEGRARSLSSRVKTPFSIPHTDGENKYVTFDTLASKAEQEGNEVGATNYWREMSRVLKADDRDERKWVLLANKRADELEARVRERREFVIEQLNRAEGALQSGRPTESVAIRAMLKDKYGHYTDMFDLLGPPAPANPPERGPSSSPASGTGPAPAPASSDGPIPGPRPAPPSAEQETTTPPQ